MQQGLGSRRHHDAAIVARKTNISTTTTPSPISFTNTAKLPIDVVKKLIAAVERRPNLWLKNSTNGQKRCDITQLWYDVSQDVNLPVDICRIKWGHLRDNFRKVYIRNHLSDATPTTWRFYSDMRFMEKPVAENIIQQGRCSSGKKLSYWQQNNSSGGVIGPAAKDVKVPICELTEGCYERDLHQPSFSDITSFFNDSHSPASKRIKYEYSHDFKASNIGMDFGTSMSGNYSQPDDDLNDDDFDEDAATDDNEPEQLNGVKRERVSTVTGTNDDVFTIEVLDDDDEAESSRQKQKQPLEQHQASTKHSRSSDTQTLLPFKNITTDAATNTEPEGAIDGETREEGDAERMFLLSLLPFMQKIDDRRKLRVRQKLQNVLIEEFG